MSAAAKGLGWYWNRLRLMSPAELLYRVQQASGKLMAGARAAPPPVPAPSTARFGRPWCAQWPTGVGARPHLEAADAVLAGRWNVFALRAAPLGFPPRWNTDPQTGTHAPMTLGKRLNYRDERLVGNIKYLWEPSRHLELSTLAQAWHLSGERRYLDGCRLLLQSWLDQCPYPLGVHWASSLELAIRLLNWATSWHLLGGAESPLFEGENGQALKQRWLESVYRHATFIQSYFSRYSSANNHLLGEYMGLFIAGITWPCWPQAQRWRDEGQRGFEREALLQNFEDGVNREQAVYYHHEVADMMLLCGLHGRANGVEFSPAYWQRLQSMLGFLHAVRDAGGHVPMIGDADDALMVRFDPRPDFDPYDSLLATGALLFGRPEWHPAPHQDRKTRWLLGDLPAAAPGVGMQPSHTTAFPQGGYWVLTHPRGAADEIHVVADAGPLGYLSIAAHGHADALSFVMSVAGQELLVDPGTYAYHTQAVWRNYFRGTSAHNTLRVDGVDQSQIGGNFMWLAKANARCTAYQDETTGVRWAAEHDGYRRLRDPVMHQRELLLDRAQRVLTVTDRVLCKGEHEVELFWHFAEHCQPVLDGPRGLHVEVGGRSVRFEFDGPWQQVSLHRGETDPPLGWISRRFDEKQPIWVARCRGRVRGDAQMTTRIVC